MALANVDYLSCDFWITLKSDIVPYLCLIIISSLKHSERSLYMQQLDPWSYNMSYRKKNNDIRDSTEKSVLGKGFPLTFDTDNEHEDAVDGLVKEFECIRMSE